MAEDWNARADREAAAVLASVDSGGDAPGYGTLQKVVALAWLEGYKDGMHETMTEAQASLQRIVRLVLGS